MGKLKRVAVINFFFLFQLICVASFGQNGSGNTFNNLHLKTLDGKDFKISTFNKKILAVVFLSPECPLSQNYTLTLNKLFTTYKEDIDIVGVFPGKSYTSNEYYSFKKKYTVQFVLLADKSKTVVKNLGAKITPEVFLLDEQRKILYHGAIDNWAVDLGKLRNNITQHYMENAITDYLQGMPIAVKETKPVGCFINDL